VIDAQKHKKNRPSTKNRVLASPTNDLAVLTIDFITDFDVATFCVYVTTA
jgi:hypothetical protein